MTIIMKCTCKHEGQDELHGKGMRVWNKTTKGKAASSADVWRCTVCRSEKAAAK